MVPSNPSVCSRQGAASLGSSLPSPLAGAELAFLVIPSPREEPQGRASGICRKKSQASFQAGAGAPEPCSALAAAALRHAGAPGSLIGRQLLYNERTEAGKLRESSTSAPRATKSCSFSPD